MQMASTSRSDERLTGKPPSDDELEVIENGGLSSQPSIRTDDDTNSEIVRIEQKTAQDETYQVTAFGRIVKTLQVSANFFCPTPNKHEILHLSFFSLSFSVYLFTCLSLFVCLSVFVRLSFFVYLSICLSFLSLCSFHFSSIHFIFQLITCVKTIFCFELYSIYSLICKSVSKVNFLIYFH